jgi:membrane fusion protein (multidrug efflux system)
MALAIVAAATGCQRSEASPTPAEQRKAQASTTTQVRVEVARLEQTAARVSLRLPGEVQGFRDARLSASLGGYVEALAAKVGDEVKQGALLARIDTATHLARLNQAKVEVTQAEREQQRALALGDAIPSAERDAAEARALAAKAAVRTAEVAVSRASILAPFAGTIASVDAEVGEVVAPGAPLIRLVQLDPVKVTLAVPARDVVSLKVGAPAVIQVDASSARVSGTVYRIEPAADLKTRSFVVEVEAKNAERALLPGMIATVEISSTLAEQGLVIPQDWLVTGLEQVGIFLNVDGVARFRKVELGPIVRNQVLVKSGLSVGDLLVITGHRDLAEGDALLVSRAGVCCSDGRVRFD